MDKVMMDLVEKHTPQLNEQIVNGYGQIMLKKAPDYVDTIFAWAFKSLESLCDLHYNGYEICTPKEEFDYIALPRTLNGIRRSSMRSVNIGESSIYLVKYFFTYKGERLDPLYLYLPFCEDAGMIMSGGTRRYLFPVLSNKIISSTKKGIFIKILKDKKNFTRLYHKVFVNGQLVNIGVIVSPLYDATVRRARLADTHSTAATNVHYILAKYGYRMFWQKYYGWIPEMVLESQVDLNAFDTDKFALITSTHVKPKTVKDLDYRSTDIAFIVPKEKLDADVLSSIVTMFYIIEHFPDKLKIPYILPEGDVNASYVWNLTLGYINFSSIYRQQELVVKMNEHFASLEDSMHELHKHKLEEIGYQCNDIYDLLFFIKRDFAKWHTHGDSIRRMDGKELDVLNHTLSKLVTSIFTASYDIKKKLNSGKVLTKSEITDLLRKNIKRRYVFRLFENNAANKSNAFDVAYSGDNKFFKITSTIIPQEGKSGSHTGGATADGDPNIKLHSSYAECGAYLAIAKREPIGNGSINPAVQIDAYGTLVPREEFKEMLAEAQRKIDS